MDLEWLKSKCIGTYLHRFKIWKMSNKCVAEICEICREEIFFPVVNGKTDNLDYLDYHLRNALKPSHPYFKAEYPNAKI